MRAAFLYVIVSGQQFSDVSWERGSEWAGEVKSEQKFYFNGWFTSIGSHLRHKEQFWLKNSKFGLS